MIQNPGAESGSAEGWSGLENMHRGELGIRRGAGHTGEYAFCWRGQSAGINSDWMAVDTQKAYKLTGHFRAESGGFTGLVFGVVMADEQRRTIKRINIFSLPGTLTELAAPCHAGDRVLRVKDAAKWQAGPSFAAAFGAGANRLTFDLAPAGITEIRKDEGNWAVALSKPCGLDFPAGTSVAENSAGGNGIFLPAAAAAEISGTWTACAGEIESGQWWPGTAYAQVVVTGLPLRRGADGPALLLDDFDLRAARSGGRHNVNFEKSGHSGQYSREKGKHE